MLKNNQSFLRKTNTKSLKQSKLITQRPKPIFESPKPIFCIKSVIIQHLKTSHNLSKTIKFPKYDTFYSHSKAETAINKSDIDEVFKSIYTTIISNIKNFLGKCSGWIVDSVIKRYITP